MSIGQGVPSHRVSADLVAEQPAVSASGFLLETFGRGDFARVGKMLRVFLSLHGTPEELDAYIRFLNEPGRGTLPALVRACCVCCQRAAGEASPEDLRRMWDLLALLSSGHARSTFVTPPELARAVETVNLELARRELGETVVHLDSMDSLPRIPVWNLLYRIDCCGKLMAACCKDGKRRSDWHEVARPAAELPPPVPPEADSLPVPASAGSDSNEPDSLVFEESANLLEEIPEDPEAPEINSGHEEVPVDIAIEPDATPAPPEPDDAPEGPTPRPADVDDDGEDSDDAATDPECDDADDADDTPESPEPEPPEDDTPGEIPSDSPNPDGPGDAAQIHDDGPSPNAVTESAPDAHHSEDLPSGGLPPSGEQEHFGRQGVSTDQPAVYARPWYMDCVVEEGSAANVGSLVPKERGQVPAEESASSPVVGLGLTGALPPKDAAPPKGGGFMGGEFAEKPPAVPPPPPSPPPAPPQITSTGPCAFESPALRGASGSAEVLLHAMGLCAGKSLRAISGLFSGGAGEQDREQTGDILTCVVQKGECILERKGAVLGKGSTVKDRPDLTLLSVQKTCGKSQNLDASDSAEVLKILGKKEFGLTILKYVEQRAWVPATFYVVQLDHDREWPDFSAAEETLSNKQRWQFDGAGWYAELSGDEVFALLNINGSTDSNSLFHFREKFQIKFIDGGARLYCNGGTLKALFPAEGVVRT